MGMRSVGSTNLSFGMVNVPVKAYVAASGDSVRFNQLHESCGSRIKQQIHCPSCEQTVQRNETVKGYEHAKGRYVHFHDNELKALESESKDTADIREFVPASDVGILHTEKCYYLAPDKGGDKAFSLLRGALRRTETIAVAQWTHHGREHLVAVRPHGNALLMQQCYYAHEVRDPGELKLPTNEPPEAEMDLAVKLVEQHRCESFDPSRYEDRYSRRVEAAVEARVAGSEVSPAPEPQAEGAFDLFEALQKSVDGGKSDKGQSPKGSPKKASGKKHHGSGGRRKKKAANG